MTSTRPELLDAALSALNRRPTATMAEIATAIGVSRATLHRHFESRESLITEMAERSLDRWEQTQVDAALETAAASGDAQEIATALRRMVHAYVQDADDFGFLLTDEFALTVPHLEARSHALVDREVAFYTAAQAAGVLRADLPPRWIADAVFGALVAARSAIRWGDVARRDLEALVETTILQGVGR
jgi:AcrR family transcriptional regulator